MIELIITALVVYRITYMLVDQEGPMRIFEHIRKLSYKQPGNFKLFNFDCFDCLNVWIAIILGLILKYNIWQILAVSALAIIINRIAERLEP